MRPEDEMTIQTGGFGLIGEKLGHSFSPILHAHFGDYPYSLMEIPRESIDDYFENGDFAGANVTIPYKEIAMRHCRADENAKKIGCVNTLIRTADGLCGCNTDTFGFEYMAGRAGIGFKGKKVTILGSGGTCRTAAITVSRLGASSVTVVSRHPSDMQLQTECPVRYVSYDEKHDDCEILINTTPVGMFPEISGIPEDINNNNCYVNLRAVLDVIYNPLRTRFVSAAIKRGIPATGGLPMLVAQGYFASKVFTGGKLSGDPVGDLTKSERDKLEEVIRIIARSQSSVVLTGMPGSGKSTVGRIIAEKLNKEFVDTDEMFTEANGTDPGSFIRENGEKKFRILEKEAVKEAARTGGRVIATGGGVVLDPGNMEYLGLNGTVIYLHRKLSDLATDNRPLSEGAENLKALYWKRLPIYLSICDMNVEVRGTASDVADEVINGLHNHDVLTDKKACGEKEEKMNILVINGPNLNMLGIREPDIYGKETYDDLMAKCRAKAEEINVQVDFYQSNHEGDLVDIIQQAYGTVDGIVINPGAYTHTSVAILDALKTVGIPAVEVHISDVDSREEFRKTSYIRQYVIETITGQGLDGYTMAMETLTRRVGP